VFRTELWKKSGHYENYKDDMFLLDVNDEEYGLKPMNCPGHATIFDQQSWSYRDLPQRYFENGKVYRKEQRGELSGLSRVWSFTIDDGHLFVRPDQIRQEIESVIEMIFEVVETLDLDVEVALATRPDKSVGGDDLGSPRKSSSATCSNRAATSTTSSPATAPSTARPEIDFGFEDALGRVWDGPTVQLDFNMPDRFDLTYTGEDNEDHQPVMIHRALYGSYERFFMVLIEHFDGDFPAVARARTGPHPPRLRRDARLRPPREKRTGGRRLPRRGRGPRLDGRSQDPRRSRRPAPVHGHRRRGRAGGGHRLGP